jgi:hypothetical protein
MIRNKKTCRIISVLKDFYIKTPIKLSASTTTSGSAQTAAAFKAAASASTAAAGQGSQEASGISRAKVVQLKKAVELWQRGGGVRVRDRQPTSTYSSCQNEIISLK